jgi:hypothetical protein
VAKRKAIARQIVGMSTVYYEGKRAGLEPTDSALYPQVPVSVSSCMRKRLCADAAPLDVKAVALYMCDMCDLQRRTARQHQMLPPDHAHIAVPGSTVVCCTMCHPSAAGAGLEKQRWLEGSQLR